MQNYKIFQIVLLLTPFVFSFAFGLDIYIPVIPQMTEIFETTPALIHLTLSLFLFTTGLGQLFIGPLSDRFGRKIVFYSSSLSYLIGSIGCAFAPNIACLIAGRFVCALGACGMLVNSFAIVRDLYSHEESARIYSFLNGAIGVSPTFAPVLGGYLSIYFGWQSIFIFLALIGVLTFAVTRFYIFESLPVEKRVPLGKEVFTHYLKIFSNRQFLIYTLVAGLAEGVFFCFFSISPFIIIDLLEVATQNFGYYFGIFGAVIALGGFGGGKIIEKVGIDITIAIGITLMLIGGVSMVAWHFLAPLSLVSFLLPMVLACTGAIFVVGACASGALEHFAAIAGTAAAAFGASEFCISSVIGALLMLSPVNSTLPYGVVIILTAFLSFIIFRLRRNIKISQKSE